MKHPTTKQIASYLDGEASPIGDQRLQEHLSTCPNCCAVLVQLRTMRQAIRATAPPLPGFGEAASFVATLNRRIRSARPSMWRNACFAAPIALALAGLGAQVAAWAIVSGDMLQRIGVVPKVAPQVSTWAIETATAPFWQRIVYEPLGWSEQEVISAVSQMMSPMQNDTLRPLWAALIMALPLTLLFGIGILATSWFVCWTGPGNRE